MCWLYLNEQQIQMLRLPIFVFRFFVSILEMVELEKSKLRIDRELR